MMTLVHFRTTLGEWAVPIERVHEVRLAQGIAPLPVPRQGIAGLLRRDDEVLTVISLLGEGAGHVIVLTCPEGWEDEHFGLLAEAAIGILRVDDTAVTPPPAGQEDPVVTGVIRENDGRMVMLLDVDQLARVLQ
ncbi:MAG TPA: CheW domain-containing protein [Candidatus Binatia bacterium]|nr:CheW domain-containing protein [Candidatus Binatia bacterium]